MRVVDRKTFLTLPAGAIYCKGEQWFFGGISIKGDSLENDWIYLDPAWPCSHDPGEACMLMETSLDTGSSFAGEDAYGRDGCFNDENIFLIFEKDDLMALRSHIDAALKNC